MEIVNNGMQTHKEWGYKKIEQWNDTKTNRLAELYKEVLSIIGENPKREGLLKTPERVAKAIQFLTRGYSVEPDDILKSAMFKEDYQHMIIVKDIELYSLCEHHLIPFFGKAHIAYIPNGYITGLSKIARLVEIYSQRLQIQERLTVQIRDCIQNILNPLGVAVVIEAQHMCMTMRGVQKQNSVTTTSAFTGQFLKEETRIEFMTLIESNLH
jgi:GTP cyclohydrolase IA